MLLAAWALRWGPCLPATCHRGRAASIMSSTCCTHHPWLLLSCSAAWCSMRCPPTSFAGITLLSVVAHLSIDSCAACWGIALLHALSACMVAKHVKVAFIRSEDDGKLLMSRVLYHSYCLLCRLLQRWRSGENGSRRQRFTQLPIQRCWKDCWQMMPSYIASLSCPLGLTSCPKTAWNDTFLNVAPSARSACLNKHTNLFSVSAVLLLHTSGPLLSPHAIAHSYCKLLSLPFACLHDSRIPAAH